MFGNGTTLMTGSAAAAFIAGMIASLLRAVRG